MVELVSSLERAAHLVGLYLEPTLRDLGITQAEAHVLARLARTGATPIAALHHEFGHKRSTLTNVVDRLEQRGSVRREVNPRDRRSFLVHLTVSGRPVARRVTRALEALDRELARPLRERDLVGLESVVRSLERVVRESHDMRG
jgi:DNA-binding MarR family transcriptional regulator